MNRIQQWIPTAVLIILCAGTTGMAQTPVSADSTVPLERIEATIAFLEDSQQVASTIERLKLLADARRQLDRDPAEESVGGPGGVNLFLSMRETGRKLRSFYRELIPEIRTFKNGVQGVFLVPDTRDRVFTLLLLGAVALLAGLLAGTGLWRFGRKLLHGGTPDDGTPRKGAGITGMVITRSAFGIGAGAALLVIGILSAGTMLQRFFISFAGVYLVYLAIQTLLYVLFSPLRSQLRTIPCSDTTAKEAVRRIARLLRTVLALYLLYIITDTLQLIYCRTAVGVFFQILMTIILPLTVLRLRSLYLPPFRQFRSKRQTYQRWFACIEFILARLPLLLLLYMIVLTGISLAGPSGTYRFFIRGSVATTGLFLAGALMTGGWKMIIRAVADTQKKMLAQYNDLQDRVAGNMRVLTISGYVVIAAAMLVVLVRIWGVRFSALLHSPIPVVQATVRIVAIAAGIWVTIQAAYFIVNRFQKTAQSRMLRAPGANPVEIEKRIATLGEIFRKIITVAVSVLGVIMILDELGFDIKAMVAGVGIVGLAVGFGAQNLVRDVISGLFVIFENRIRVGDVAIINGTGGLVEQVNLRTSVLRGLDGTVHVFPNGEIASLSNMTHEFSYYVFDVGVAYKEDTDRVSQVLRELGEEIRSDPEYRDAILEPLEILGVDAFADSAVIVKARIKTVPIKQWFVGREMNRRIKKRFDELGIEIPFPHQTLYFGEASKPFALSMNSTGVSGREEIERIVGDILDRRSGTK